MNIKLSDSQTVVLLEIFQILRNEQNRLARKNIYELYMKKKLGARSRNKQVRLYIEKLNGDFDEIGFLAETFDVKDMLFALYSDTIRRVWLALQNDIQREQNARKINDPEGKNFGYFFTNLALEAKKYRDKRNLKEPGFTDLSKL
jgi:hypothetical protein